MIRGLTREDKSLLMEALGSLIDELTRDFLESQDETKKEHINEKIFACEDLIQKLEER